jgi:hypothetical protein
LSPLLRPAGISGSSVLIADLWPVSFLIGLIFYDLQSTVWQEDAVGTLCIIVLATFLLAEFSSRFGVLDFIRVLVIGWLL